MTSTAIPLKEFDEEMAATRRALERVPDDKAEWKPHDKSFPLAHLAQLIATMPAWFAPTLQQPFIDLAGGAGYGTHPTSELLGMFDAGVKSAREALEQVTGDALGETWELRRGEHVLWTVPRGEAVRDHLRHLVHHRGQLTVYLRLLDVPVPSIYGPSADERPW
jgi:uncharacterized damage-inducible protein DinB